VKHKQHRQFMVLSGEADWCRTQAQALLPGEHVIWISSEAPANVKALTARKAINLLGGERDALVFDAHSGFDADVFGAVTGVLRGGGVLLMLTPELSAWPGQVKPGAESLQIAGYASADLKHRFICRLSRLLSTTAGLVHVRQGESLPVITVEPAAREESLESFEQAQAVAAVTKVATGHRRRPLVLTADRGRGKSAAFGMAAAELLRQGKCRILVTAPRLDAVTTLFQHAAASLPLCEQSAGLIKLEDQRIEFVAPDALILNPQAADLLLVDEAAGIPASLLQKLLTLYARIAFATTVHGYEGTGRGFVVRFNRVLDQLTPQWKSLQLNQPIRWAADDPLEKFTFDALLLDVEPAENGLLQDVSTGEVLTEHLPREQLLADEALLRQLFGLLVIAHYRTRPMDLKNLLDGPNVSVWVSRYQGQVVATALLAKEGGFDTELAAGVWQGIRRPQGHLLPQTLAAKVGLQEAAQLKYNRIIRIAVHPVLQGRGLGSQLLGHLIEHSRQQGLDCIGSSFGATEELLRFWYRRGFWPVRLGMHREASSGAHSALLLRPLSDRGVGVYEQGRQYFMRQFPLQLGEQLKDLDAGVAVALMASARQAGLSDQQYHELQIFAGAGRDYADCLHALHEFALSQCTGGQLSMAGRKLLMIKILQGRSWQDTARLTGLSGRKQVLGQLRDLVRTGLA
jgi:tRNA(Met) cytidine acetyltransferase